MTFRTHRDLIVWQKSMSLAREIYRLVAMLPADERFGLASQLRNAVISIIANVAEGNGRTKRGDYPRFLAIARGSARELDALLELSVLVGVLAEDESRAARSLLDEVARMLTAMLRKLTL